MTLAMSLSTTAAFILHSEYTTSCFMAKIALNSNFIQPYVCKYVLFFFSFFFFFFLSVRWQVSFILMRFRYFGRRFSFRIVDLSRESRVIPPRHDFRGKESK